MNFTHLMLVLAAQDPSVVDKIAETHPATWPLYAAIVALFGALSAGAGAVWKAQTKQAATHAAQIEALGEAHAARLERNGEEVRLTMEARAKRISEEFNRKDELMLGIAREQTAAFEKFAAAINELTDAVREGGDVSPEVMRMYAQVADLWTWVGKTDTDTEVLRVYTPKRLLSDVKQIHDRLDEIHETIKKIGPQR